MDALIIEVALNGTTPRERQRHVPQLPVEVAADAIACLEAGAAIIHSHTHEVWEPVHSAAPYIEAWRPVQERYPDALFFATNPGGTLETVHRDRSAHIVELQDAGLTRMSFVEPGSLTLGSVTADGSPAREGWMYLNTHAEIGAQLDFCRARRLVPRVAIFEPGFARMLLAHHASDPLPSGTMLTLIFGDGALLFGLPSTAVSLDAYLQLLDGTGLKWMVASYGGDVVASGLAQLAVERGGHVRVGLEDYAGTDQPTNAELVAQVTELARAAGRPVATSAQAAKLLDLAV